MAQEDLNGMNLDVRLARLEEQFVAAQKAVKLQADEYERRLNILNHAHEQIQQIVGETISTQRFEQYAETEAEKREVALDRVNERFNDYIKRYEQRQREVDQALTIQKTAADSAKQFATEAANKAQIAVQEAAQKANLRIAGIGVFLTAVVIVVNLLTTH
jgi:hypothetical protein